MPAPARALMRTERLLLPLLVRDQCAGAGRLAEPFEVLVRGHLLDGPVTERVAVLDFDEETQELRPGARLRPRRPGEPREYQTALAEGAAEDLCLDDRRVYQVCALGAVLRTLQLFEEPDVLGRAVSWAFSGPQLLVVPQAGLLSEANAAYDRRTRSLQFFSFPALSEPGRRVPSCASLDLVAHETAHAIIDGVLPDLYDAGLPQALALHEALADLSAVLVAVRSPSIAAAVLREGEGRLDRPNALSGIAELFGRPVAGAPARAVLRSLWNQRRLDEGGAEPHQLSEVLSGALYAVLVAVYEDQLGQGVGRQLAQRQRALFLASERLKRFALRALDYLPPGEVGFVDYARAALAADRAAHPESGTPREVLIAELRRRRVIDDSVELGAGARREGDEPFEAADRAVLCRDEGLAYEFALRHRDHFGVPAGCHLQVRPRLDVRRRYYHRGGAHAEVRELLFKVAWEEQEDNPVLPGLPPRRIITRGTTVAVGWESGRVNFSLTGQRGPEERSATDARLALLWADPRGAARMESSEGVMRLRGSAEALHAVPAMGRGGALALPPAGVDASAFYALLDARQRAADR